MDVAELADLLRETSIHHGDFEAVAPPPDWWDWYAAYMHAVIVLGAAPAPRGSTVPGRWPKAA